MAVFTLLCLSTFEIGEHKGEYTSSGYTCYLGKKGECRIVDIGAGNPVINGRLFQLTKDKYLLCCLFDRDFDAAYLTPRKAAIVKIDFTAETFSMGYRHRKVSFQKKPYPQSLTKILSCELPEGWKEDSRWYWCGDKDTVSEIGYVKKDGYIAISVFSYKGKDEQDNPVDIQDYIDSLENKEELEINNRKYYFGGLNQDDMENTAYVAYLTNGDYIYRFHLSNSDNPVTKGQKEDFFSMLKTLQFKERNQKCLYIHKKPTLRIN